MTHATSTLNISRMDKGLLNYVKSVLIFVDQVNLDSIVPKIGGQILVGISINYNYRGPRKVMVNGLYPEHGPFLGPTAY